MFKNTKGKIVRGFTLIELLIVIAILGILAAAILVAINPLEQLAKSRDAGRKSTVSQLGNAVQSYYTSQSAQYPGQGPGWMTTLQTSGELKVLPTNAASGAYLAGCNVPNVQQVGAGSGYCYQTDQVDAIVYARAESKSSLTTGTCTGTQVGWIVWSSAEGKTGIACLATGADPAVGITGLK